MHVSSYWQEVDLPRAQERAYSFTAYVKEKQINLSSQAVNDRINVLYYFVDGTVIVALGII